MMTEESESELGEERGRRGVGAGAKADIERGQDKGGQYLLSKGESSDIRYTAKAKYITA